MEPVQPFDPKEDPEPCTASFPVLSLAYPWPHPEAVLIHPFLVWSCHWRSGDPKQV